MEFAATVNKGGPGIEPGFPVRVTAKDLPLFPSRPNLFRSPGDPPPPEDNMILVPAPKNETGAIYNQGGRIAPGSIAKDSDAHEVEAPESEGDDSDLKEKSAE